MPTPLGTQPASPRSATGGGPAPTGARPDTAFRPTIVHVTHEAIDHLGGIGTVLQGLLTSRAYHRSVAHNVLVGPLPHPHARVDSPLDRLGSAAVACVYSGPDNHDPEGLGALLRPIEWAFGTPIVLGRRVFHEPGAIHDPARAAHADVLLIDVSNPNRERLAGLKWLLWEKFGVDSTRHEHSWDYEEYGRLADPAYHALCAILPRTEWPAVVIAHEFMGLATAMRCSLDRARFRTVFHAHECSTARRVIESLPGHDAAFYPAMRAGAARGLTMEQVFGDQSDFGRHTLVSRAHVLDESLAVGPETKNELHFLSPAMAMEPIRIAYNGLPAPPVTWDEKQRSRALVSAWLKNVLGFSPDYLITHVTRPVPSKGLWRDVKVCLHLEPHLKAAGKSAAYVLLTCGAPVRTATQVNQMAREYGWPAHHREGHADLAGAEIAIGRDMLPLIRNNPAHDFKRPPTAEPGKVYGLLVNQFGFTRERLGDAAPEGLSIDDLRRAADVELGMSVYEPFGIAMLEPLHAGGVCVVSSVCGCCGLVQRAMDELGLKHDQCPLVLTADFTHDTAARGSQDADLPTLVGLTASARDAIEERVCTGLAAALAQRLPRNDDDRRRYLDLGQRLAARMSWDRVVETDFLPAVLPLVHGGASAFSRATSA